MLIALVKSIHFILAHKQYAEGIVYPKNTVCTANTAIAAVTKNRHGLKTFNLFKTMPIS